VLVLVHVTAAVYHHAVLKDEVLTRMPPGKR
jgi:cytochrome b561